MIVTLQFQNLEDLARFKSILQTNNFELNAWEFTITCDCSEKEIEEAVIHCGASIVSSSFTQTEKQSSFLQ